MLEINHVSVEFEGAGVKAVDDMCLCLPEGSRTAIIGETGSGKSVLLVALIRLLPPNARISGEILLDGQDLLSLPEKQMQKLRGSKLAYVPQGGGGSMNPLMTVGYQVGEPRMIHGKESKKSALAAAEKLLERFGLTPGRERSRAYPHMFSGGMRQRAMVAMGIAAGAGLLLADEPTKGLDEARVQTVTQAFRQLRGETLLCVTHDVLFAKAVSDQVSVMYAACQLECGETRRVLEHPLHPYTQDLIAAMPENGMRYEDHGFAPPHEDYLEESKGCRYYDRCRRCWERCKENPPLFDVDGQKVRCWLYADGNRCADETLR